MSGRCVQFQSSCAKVWWPLTCPSAWLNVFIILKLETKRTSSFKMTVVWKLTKWLKDIFFCLKKCHVLSKLVRMPKTVGGDPGGPGWTSQLIHWLSYFFLSSFLVIISGRLSQLYFPVFFFFFVNSLSQPLYFSFPRMLLCSQTVLLFFSLLFFLWTLKIFLIN